MSVAALLLHHDDHREKHRWSGCFAAVIGVHVAAALLFIAWRTLAPAPEPLPPAILIDMLPAPTPPAPPPPAPKIKPPEPKKVVKPPVRKPAPIKKELPVAPSEAELPAAPKPVPAPTTQAAPAAPVTAPSVPSPSKVSFEALLLAHLEKHKRYPPEARMRRQQGVSYLYFVMDRQGRVLNHKLQRSSGSSFLDDEVLALIQRAQPLPPIPADRPEDQLEFIVPIQFSIR